MAIRHLHALPAASLSTLPHQRSVLTRRQLLKAGAVTTALALGSSFGHSSVLWAGPTQGGAPIEPVPIPGGTPELGGAFHVFGPALIDPIDAEPATITDFNGFSGLAFISGTVTRTNTKTGEERTLPYVESDMRFMKGVFRGTDGRRRQGAFAFV
jgi:hypothetical protein